MKTNFLIPRSCKTPSSLELKTHELSSIMFRRSRVFGESLIISDSYLIEGTAWEMHLYELLKDEISTSLIEIGHELHLLKILDSRKNKERKVNLNIYGKPDTFRWLATFNPIETLSMEY